MKSFAACIVLFLTTVAALAAEAPPIVRAITPSALQPGVTNRVVITGENLNGVSQLWTSFKCDVQWLNTNSATELIASISPDASPRSLGALRIVTTNGLSSLHFVTVLSEPLHLATQTNQTVATATRLPIPSVVEGIIRESAQSDFYVVHVEAGDRLIIESIANRIGSPLDPLIRLLHANAELALNDDTPLTVRDARLEIDIATTGDHVIELRDTAFASGDQHRYQLRVTRAKNSSVDPRDFQLPFLSDPHESCQSESEPNQTTNAATTIAIPATISGEFREPNDRDQFRFDIEKPQRLLIRAKTRELGSPCDAWLRVTRADGREVAALNVSDTDDGTLSVTCDSAGTYFLEIRELSGRSGLGHVYEVRVEAWLPGFQVTTQAEKIEATPGETISIALTCARRDYTGPIIISATGLPEEATIENATIEEKKNEGTVKIKIPDHAIPGAIYPFQLHATGSWKARTLLAPVSSAPGLKKTFPFLLYPPAALTRSIHQGIKAK